MALMWPSRSFLGSILALISCGVLGSSSDSGAGMARESGSKSLILPPALGAGVVSGAFSRNSAAWVTPAPWRGRASPWSCPCTMISPVHGGSGVGGGDAAGNQGTGGTGRNNNRGGGVGSLDDSSSSSSSNAGGSDRNNNKNNTPSGGSEGDAQFGGGDVSALERQFSRPAAPRGVVISEGLGKGAPSPSQRLRMQQQNLDMRWQMASTQNRTVCCRHCAGEGVQECRFCSGSGMFKIGEELMVDPETGRPTPCPVCKSKGEEVCSRCNGAGRIASWLLRSERRKGNGDSPRGY